MSITDIRRDTVFLDLVEVDSLLDCFDILPLVIRGASPALQFAIKKVLVTMCCIN